MRSISAILRSPAAVFASGSYLAIVLNLLQGVLFMRILGPEQYGVWLSLLLLFRYGQHVHLGANQSVLRQLPLLKGKGDLDAVAGYAANGRGMIALASVGWSVLGAALIPFFYADVKLGAAVLILVTAMEMWWQQGIAELKTQHRFGVVASMVSARAALNLALLPMVLWLDLDGAYLRWILLMVVILAWTWRRNPVGGGISFDWSTFGRIVRDGGPILAVGMVFTLQVGLDQTLIFLGLGDQALGRYGVAALLMTIMLVIPSAVGQTAYPRILEQYGRDGDVAALHPGVRRRTWLVTAVSAVIAVIGALALPWVVRWIMPAYLPGVTAAQWLMPGGVFLAASVPSSDFLMAVEQRMLHLRISLLAVTIQLVAGLAVLRTGGDIEEIAATTTASFAIYSLLLIVGATRHARGSR
jgi:O-antigen/teichoic acid export membrane protein